MSRRGVRRSDDLRLLARLRASVDEHLAHCLAHSNRLTLSQTRVLVLTLELRLKLEQQLVLPALREAGASPAALLAQERDLKSMRDLSDRLRAVESGPAERQVALCALHGVVALHFNAMDQLLDRLAEKLDHTALADEIRALLKRWQTELDLTGDIEDEELDPVGLPPR